jgi:YtkA-like
VPVASASRRTRSMSTMRALIVASLALLAACVMPRKPGNPQDYARTRTSQSGLYTATILPQGDSIPRGKLHRWTLHLETATGVPVDSASMTVNGGMPQHGHGLPTTPRVTRALGHGDHLVEGMKFNMGGWWVVKFHVNAAAGADSLEFNLKL